MTVPVLGCRRPISWAWRHLMSIADAILSDNTLVRPTSLRTEGSSPAASPGLPRAASSQHTRRAVWTDDRPLDGCWLTRHQRYKATQALRVRVDRRGRHLGPGHIKGVTRPRWRNHLRCNQSELMVANVRIVRAYPKRPRSCGDLRNFGGYRRCRGPNTRPGQSAIGTAGRAIINQWN